MKNRITSKKVTSKGKMEMLSHFPSFGSSLRVVPPLESLVSFCSPSKVEEKFYEKVFEIFKDERMRINFFTFCSGLRIFTNYNHRSLKRMSDSFIKINVETIRKSMTSLARDHSKLIKLMIDNNFIECDKSFSKGNFSQGYRFGAEMINLKWEKPDYKEFLKFIAPKTGHKKVFQRLPERFALKLTHWSGAVTEWIREVCELAENEGKNLRVNYPDNFDEMVDEVAARKYEKYLKEHPNEPYPLELHHFAANHRLNLDRIAQLEFSAYIQEGGFSNRLFSEITSLPSEYRKLVTNKDQEFFNVDLRCAQCCFLAAFYDSSEDDQKEKSEFIAAMQNPDKDLYSLLAETVNLSRADAKEKIFTIFFGPNYMQTGKICLAFKKLFPILSQKLYTAKLEDYTNVARIMQGTECEIIIKNSLLPLLKEKVPVFSIHDSLMTTKEFLPKVKNHIEAAFEAKMGFKPILKIE